MGFQFNATSNTVAITGEVSATFTEYATTADDTTGAAESRTDTYTVPAGKYWLVKRATAYRQNAGGINLQLGETVIYIFGPTTGTVTIEFDNIRLNAGDTFVFDLQAGSSGTLISTLLYEERPA